MNAPAAVVPVLVLAAAPNVVSEIARAALAATADPRMRVFGFDLRQAYRPDDAAELLGKGFDGRPHLVLLVGGDLAGALTRRQLDGLREAALASDRIVMVGIADDDRSRSRLAEIGLRRVVSSLDFGADFVELVRAANADRLEEHTRLAALAAQQGPQINITNVPREGLLRDSGVIAVHSTKGGSGKTTIATNLALALANSGRSTVIADFNSDGSCAHTHFARLIQRAEGIDDLDDIFESRGLSFLAPRIRHDMAHGAVGANDVEASLIRLGPDLAILPGVRDQSDYRAGIKGASRATAQLLQQQGWVGAVVTALRSPASGFSYVVIDTGTGRYTGPVFGALSVADVAIYVINAAMPSNLDADLRALREIATSGGPALRAKRVIVANQLQRDVPGAPRFEQIRRDFAFFGAEAILPVHEDRRGLTAANAKGIPFLAEPENLTTPLGAELLAVVNVISNAYGVEEVRAQRRSFRPGLGGLRGKQAAR